MAKFAFWLQGGAGLIVGIENSSGTVVASTYGTGLSITDAGNGLYYVDGLTSEILTVKTGSPPGTAVPALTSVPWVGDTLAKHLGSSNPHPSSNYTKTEIDAFFDGTGATGKKLVRWNDLTGVPSTFTPATHTHSQYYDNSAGETNIKLTQVSGLPGPTAANDGKLVYQHTAGNKGVLYIVMETGTSGVYERVQVAITSS